VSASAADNWRASDGDALLDAIAKFKHLSQVEALDSARACET